MCMVHSEIYVYIYVLKLEAVWSLFNLEFENKQQEKECFAFHTPNFSTPTLSYFWTRQNRMELVEENM